MSPEAAEARLRLEIDRQTAFGFQYWPIFDRSTGDFAGCAGLRPWFGEPRIYEMGVHMARPYWGRRMGEEAARAVIRHAFEVLGADALTAGHHPDNANSRSLLRRLGFVFTHESPWGPLGIQHCFYRLEQ